MTIIELIQANLHAIWIIFILMFIDTFSYFLWLCLHLSLIKNNPQPALSNKLSKKYKIIYIFIDQRSYTVRSQFKYQPTETKWNLVSILSSPIKGWPDKLLRHTTDKNWYVHLIMMWGQHFFLVKKRPTETTNSRVKCWEKYVNPFTLKGFPIDE